MKIGLIDVDGHNFPNLALMKLSAWHKGQGDDVEMVFPMGEYDRVYMSKVFDFTPDFTTCVKAKEIIKGGTGYDMSINLPAEVETMYPDYSLYGIADTAYGYLTRFASSRKKRGAKVIRLLIWTDSGGGRKRLSYWIPTCLPAGNT